MYSGEGQPVIQRSICLGVYWSKSKKPALNRQKPNNK